MIAVGASGTVLYWSPSAERLLGRPAGAAVGRPLAARFGFPALAELETAGERQLQLTRAGGGALRVLVSTGPLRGNDGSREGTVLTLKALAPWLGPAAPGASPTAGLDVAERLGATFRATVEATGAGLDTEETVAALAARLVEQGHRLLPGIDCLLVEVPAERQDVFRCVAGAGEFARGLAGLAVPRQGSVLGRALASRRAVESCDMPRESSEKARFAAAGVRTMRAVPLLTREPLPDGRTALGALAVFKREADPFTLAERRLIDGFGALASLSLQRTAYRAAAERSLERLRLAVDITLHLARSLDAAEVARRLVRRTAVAAAAERAVLLRVEGGPEGETVVEACHDAAGHEDNTGLRMPVRAQSLVRQAIRAGRPELGAAYDLRTVPPVLRKALAGVRHSLTVPLRAAGEVTAVLVLSRREGVPFGAEEVELLQLVGAPAALAVRNAHLYEQAQEASRVKSDFLDMAAHELRAPLGVVNGYLSLLRDATLGPPPPSWEAPLQVLSAKVVDLGRLVEDLLTAARLETGRLTWLPQPVDLREVARRAAEAAPDACRLALAAEPVIVRADSEHLGRLVGHLVANALAYGREGSPPWLRLEVRQEAERGLLAVEDRGLGVPEAMRERIFERFTRVDDPGQAVVPGTGLGLYIGRELAARLGGSLELDWSEVGAGSRFVLRLPLAEA